MKKLFKFFCFLFIIFVITIIGCFLYVKLSPKVTINSANNISLYDINKTIYFKGNESKEWVDLDDISDYLIKSTIYTEDKNFYKHFGFDFLRIGKAILTNITSHSTNQGASTITQQYAKNLFLDFDKTWKRKWDEMWYTMRIEANYSKDEILEGYLNTINYGHGKYGIENASKFYFNKSSKDLDLAEASMLSGIPKAPSIYSPIINFENAKKRQLVVLNALVSNGIISSSEKDEAYSEKLTITANSDKENLTSINYYIDAVMNELESIDSIPRNYSDYNGLKIYTNFNYNIQSSLEENVKNTFPDDSKIETSSVVMNPENGGIMALIGGKDYNNSTYNRAISSKRQVGSTMKPYLYYAALENGFTSSTAFTSEKTTFPLENGKTYSPVNYNDKYGNKAISMATAIAYSDNIYAVKTHLFLGEDSLVDIAKRVGITTNLQAVPSLALGTNEIGILEMMAGYGTLANEGYKVKPHFISKVEDINGKVLYEYKNSKESILNKSSVYILNELMANSYAKEFIDYTYPTCIGIAPKMTKKYAIKTGTTNTDHLIFGYNKDAILGIWMGYDDNRDSEVSDGNIMKNIWVDTMEEYLKDKKDNWYKTPNNVVGVLVNPITGELATESEKSKIFYYIKGTQPSSNNNDLEEAIATMKQQ